MKKVFRLAILADRTQNTLSSQTVTRYTYITAQSHEHIQYFADRIGAVVCGWRAAA